MGHPVQRLTNSSMLRSESQQSHQHKEETNKQTRYMVSNVVSTKVALSETFRMSEFNRFILLCTYSTNALYEEILYLFYLTLGGQLSLLKEAVHLGDKLVSSYSKFCREFNGGNNFGH